MNFNYGKRYPAYYHLQLKPQYEHLYTEHRSLVKSLHEIDAMYREAYIEQSDDPAEMDRLAYAHKSLVRSYVSAIKEVESKMDKIVNDDAPTATPVAEATLIADYESDDEDDDKPIAVMINEAKQENKPISKLVMEAKQENKPISTLIEKAKKNKQKKDIVTGIVNLINKSVSQTAKTGKSTTVVF